MPDFRYGGYTYHNYGVVATANVMMANTFSMMRLRGCLAITAEKEVMRKLLQFTIVGAN